MTSSIASNDELIAEPLPDVDSDDELDWEEVHVPEQEQEPLRIIIRPENEEESPKKKSTAISHAERILRIDCHKIHTVLLLMNARIRNKWLNDELLHARLLSLTPMKLQNDFATIHSSRVPDQAHRGRLFQNAITRLVEWWYTSFFSVTEYGHLRNQTFDTIQRRLATYGYAETTPETVIDDEDMEDIIDNDLELVKSPKSLMKHALMREGSRDTSAQLFTALCRGMGIPARLVVSLQSVPWKAGIGKPKPKYQRKKGKGKEKEMIVEDATPSEAVASSSKDRFADAGEGQRLDAAPIVKSEKAKGKEKAKPVIKLRKSKVKGNVLGSSSKTPEKKKKIKHDDPYTSAPIYWTEVFSKADSRWLPVDPIRGHVNKRHVFDPPPSSSDNRMVYVLAFEEDGYARDVTRRYAKEFGAKVAKVQGGSSSSGINGGGGRGRQNWWDRVMGLVTRPFRLNRDDIEDEELETAQLMEKMPTSIAGFKGHPLYVLPQHLKQNETIYPPPPLTPELGKFRGEPVYSRSAIVTLKTPENWLRSEGRKIKAGVQAMKHVKMRASTVGRQRELELLKEAMRDGAGAGRGAEGEGSREKDVTDPGKASVVLNGDAGEIMQGLYSRDQTELFVPDPVVDGIIPKNRFGNIDLYVPSMLPRGAVHIPFKGVAKIARKLHLDFAEAVTGFEFRKRKATPTLEGIVVAAENEHLVLDAYWEAEQEAQEKARIKREERVIKRWTRLIHGLRIRQRLQEQYADRLTGNTNDPAVVSDSKHEEDEPPAEEIPEKATAGGGFLIEAGDVVQPFQLPKTKIFDDTPALTPASNQASDMQEVVPLDLTTYDVEPMNVDHIPQQAPTIIAPARSNVAPKTMQELADDAARASGFGATSGTDEVELEVLSGVVPEAVQKVEAAAAEDALSRPKRTSVKLTVNGVGKRRSSDVTAPSRKSSRKRRRTSGLGQDTGSISGDDDDAENSSPPKRSRRGKAAAPSGPTPAPSTRVLRSRTAKSSAQHE